ncbi:rod shape-determining protein MreD [Metabacillus sp. GX 13764]|uniref:rod shape-determining protein MreD n=1 Tax=Metabacillus kandeliae TaxID=2900151 RepID=UPI001E56809D|nr:rod shape-determining protein MreD [Metabacillus kandeliae]
MKRFLLPFFIFLLFIAESIYADLVHLPFLSDQLIFVPRFSFLAILFICAFFNRNTAILYGAIFGLLYDIVYTEVLGIYLFSFPLLVYLMSKGLKALHNNVLVVIFLSLVAVTLLEFFVYGIQELIQALPMTLNDFVTLRLIPTLALNLAAGLVLVYPIKSFLAGLRRDLD